MFVIRLIWCDRVYTCDVWCVLWWRWWWWWWAMRRKTFGENSFRFFFGVRSYLLTLPLFLCDLPLTGCFLSPFSLNQIKMFVFALLCVYYRLGITVYLRVCSTIPYRWCAPHIPIQWIHTLFRWKHHSHANYIDYDAILNFASPILRKIITVSPLCVALHHDAVGCATTIASHSLFRPLLATSCEMRLMYVVTKKIDIYYSFHLFQRKLCV